METLQIIFIIIGFVLIYRLHAMIMRNRYDLRALLTAIGAVIWVILQTILLFHL